jgi:hypothetical protein
MYMEIPHFNPAPILKRIINFNVLRAKERLNGKQGACYLTPSATSKPLTLTGGEFL